jgi:hypothetical protein
MLSAGRCYQSPRLSSDVARKGVDASRAAVKMSKRARTGDCAHALRQCESETKSPTTGDAIPSSASRRSRSRRSGSNCSKLTRDGLFRSNGRRRMASNAQPSISLLKARNPPTRIRAPSPRAASDDSRRGAHTAASNARSIAATFRTRKWLRGKWADSPSPTHSPSASYSRTPTRSATNEPALRWLQRFIDERLPPLTEVTLAASALTELRHGNRNAGIETLKRLLRSG